MNSARKAELPDYCSIIRNASSLVNETSLKNVAQESLSPLKQQSLRIEIDARDERWPACALICTRISMVIINRRLMTLNSNPEPRRRFDHQSQLIPGLTGASRMAAGDGAGWPEAQLRMK